MNQEMLRTAVTLLKLGATLCYSKHYIKARTAPRIYIIRPGQSFTVDEEIFTHLATHGLIEEVNTEYHKKGPKQLGIGHVNREYRWREGQVK